MSARIPPPNPPAESPGPAAAAESVDAAPPDDIAGGLRFLHLMEMQTKARVAELSADVAALSELLIGGGQVSLDAYQKRRQLKVLHENERAKVEASVAVMNVPDKYALTDLPRIDCASLLPLCRARCCTQAAALSVQDLDERVVRWDYARPYFLARGDDGYCVHNERGGCGVYAERPAVCRLYDCREDRRIWIDFERRIPAP